MSLEGAKWVLVGLMVVDHLAYQVDPSGWGRLPGRLVFGGFLVLLVGNLSHGVPTGKYLWRLGVFGLLAQPGYALAFGFPLLWPLNALVALLAGVIAVRKSPWLGGIMGLLTEYPLTGIAAYLLSQGRWGWAAVAHGGSALLMGWPLYGMVLTGLSVPLWAFLLRERMEGRRAPWWFFYAFYAGHLWFLGGLRWLGVFSR
ncbi:TraX family protein [Thermus caldilimi]|uniref:TraX family protein n=1 Tax=Thermus caldilimi TaxID=2483360 RepID=UPI001075EB30|nr:TraX family protein [Thermus caldilimi]